MCDGVCVCVTGAVSLAGAQNNLWAVEGGNKLVCSGLLKMANANLLQAQVGSISPIYSGTIHRSRILETCNPGINIIKTCHYWGRHKYGS